MVALHIGAILIYKFAAKFDHDNMLHGRATHDLAAASKGWGHFCVRTVLGWCIGWVRAGRQCPDIVATSAFLGTQSSMIPGLILEIVMTGFTGTAQLFQSANGG